MSAGLGPEELQQLRRALLKKGAEINEKLVAIMNGKDPALGLLTLKPGETKEERLRRFLGLVDAQIQRIRAGSYGRCATCNELLPTRELLEIPWIDTCQRCAATAS